MQRACELTSAREELHQLREQQETLSAELSRHARELRSAGALPPEELVDRLIGFRTRMQHLTATLAVSPTSDPTDLEITLDAVQAALQTSEIQACIGTALEGILTLQHVDDPDFVPLRDCQLAAGQLKAALLANDVQQLTREGHDLARGQHPVQALWNLARADAELSDEAWAECQELVTATWGRALATAVARGKIQATHRAAHPAENGLATQQGVLEASRAAVESEDVEVVDLVAQGSTVNIHDHDLVSQPTPATDETASVLRAVAPPPVTFIDGDEQPMLSVAQPLSIFPAPAPSGPPSSPASVSLKAMPTIWHQTDDTADDSVFEPLQDSIFDTIGGPAADQLIRKSRSLDMKLLSEDPYHWAKSQPIRTASLSAAVPANGNTGILARKALQADVVTRRTLMSQLVLQLLWDDRAALAYHLTRNAETHQQGDLQVLPSWVMHALALGRHLCYSKGEIARQLEDDLKQFKPDLLQNSSPEWNAGTGFFLRAAALVPALLASSPAAAAILRSFRITPGLSHLYNYCSRVLTYGQQLHGQAADLFTPDCDLAKWELEMGALRQSVETWLPETIKKYAAASRTSLLFLHAHWTLTASPTVRHPEAVRMWSKWQEVFRIVCKLVKPIRMGQETERNWVKAEIDRLTLSLRLESDMSEAGTTAPVGALTFPQESMLAMIREAIDYASRWLRLCASKPAQGRTLASRDAEVLRDEILDRTDGVITELAAYSKSHDGVRTKAGIACLCRTIEHLRAIFSPHSTLALRENDPRHVVSADLLKISHLRLNENWMPTVDAVTLETEILSHLSHDERDWRQAFEAQSTQHDHLSTGRILELNVWRNEQERETLAQRRQLEIAECRQQLQQELETVSSRLAEVVQQRVLSDQTRASLEQRWQRLRVVASQMLDFNELHREVQGLRMAIEQRVREATQALKSRQADTAGRVPPSRQQSASSGLTDATPAGDGWAWDIFSDN